MEERVKKVIAAVLILLTVVASFVYYNNYKSRLRAASSIVKVDSDVTDNTGTPVSSVQSAEPDTGVSNKIIKVHVAGAVNNPGLYEAPGDSRVGDLIEIAGGSAPDANLDKINLAAFAEDGKQIYVPRISEATEDETVPAEIMGSGTEKLININTASLNELMSLPGIGETLGGSIIKYREANGGFKSTEDIKNVSGIGEKRYEAIMELITVK